MIMFEKRNSSQIAINSCSNLLIVVILISALTCGVRTECSEKTRIAVVMNLNSDFCKENLLKHEFSSNEEKYSVSKTNYTTEERNIEIIFFDSCGSQEEAVRLVFKVISWSNLNCLRPPYFLGFIGPEDIKSLEAILKITSPLQIPHITSIPTSLSNVHYFNSVKEFSLLQAIFKLIDELGWKSFIFEGNIKTTADKRFVQQFIEESLLKNLCILPPSEISSHIIYVGYLNSEYLNSIHNSTILVVGRHNIEQKLDDIHSTNLLLLISNSRNLSKSSAKNIYSWNFPRNNLNIDINILTFVFNAINIYAKALNHLCKNENCYSTTDIGKWNDYVVGVLSNDSDKESSEYVFKIKDNNEQIKTIGQLIKNRHEMQIRWGTNTPTSYDSVHLESILQRLKKNVENKNKAICMKYRDVFDYERLHPVNQHGKDAIIVSEVTDIEWWTMVGTVAGIGIAMFTIGFLAVYIVYTNIRGPQQKKPSHKLNFERDSSLRRIGSDKQISFTSNRNSRSTIGVQRRDSRNSIRSNVSDKSV